MVAPVVLGAVNGRAGTFHGLGPLDGRLQGVEIRDPIASDLPRNAVRSSMSRFATTNALGALSKPARSCAHHADRGTYRIFARGARRLRHGAARPRQRLGIQRQGVL